MDDPFFIKTIEIFKDFDEVDALALGGSMATGKNDSASDYDVYVYLNKDLCTEKRKNALSQTCKYMEINNTFFEPEDDCTLNSGTNLELIYRHTSNTIHTLSNHLENHIAWNGYTTCVCHSVLNAKILYDDKGIYSSILERFSMPYPEQLRKNIISLNRNLLEGKMVSYCGQLEKAIMRNDEVSINHRLTEVIKAYFDILFALNKAFHPGEKRMIDFARDLCEWLPADFEKNLHGLLAANGKDKLPIVREVVSNLDDLIVKYA